MKLQGMDEHKLRATLEFVQGFIGYVSVVYKDTVEETAVTPGETPKPIKKPVYVRVDHWESSLAITVMNPGGKTNMSLTTEAGNMACDILSQCSVNVAIGK